LQAVSASVKAVGPDMKRRAAFRPGRPCGLLLGLILPGLVGCSAARLHLLTLEYRQIEPEGPLVHEKSAREGYFWIDETDQVRIGLRDHVANWLDSDAGRTLEVSLVLDGIPADRARNYPPPDGPCAAGPVTKTSTSASRPSGALPPSGATARTASAGGSGSARAIRSSASCWAGTAHSKFLSLGSLWPFATARGRRRSSPAQRPTA